MEQELGKRLKRYLISPETLFKILKTISKDIPEDAKGVAIVYEPVRNAIELYVESPSYPLVPFGEDVPREQFVIVEIQKKDKKMFH